MKRCVEIHIASLLIINKMEEIKVDRKKGYLDLDSYLKMRLGRKFRDKQDLLKNNLIGPANGGAGEKFWILSESGEKLALFKPGRSIFRSGYAELFSEEIAKLLGMKTAHYDLAVFNGTKGVISYNFIKEGDDYSSGFDMLSDFYEFYLANNEEKSKLYGIDHLYDIDDITFVLNTIEDVWIVLEEKYKSNPNKRKIIYNIVNGLVDKFIFDIFTVNVDDHNENWGILNDEIAPHFDGESILRFNSLTMGKNSKLEEEFLELTVDNHWDNRYNAKPLENLEYFLEISSSEYIKLVENRYNLLKENIDKLPSIIEKRIEYPLSNNTKNYFITNMYEHMNKIGEVIYKKKSK